MISRHRKIRLLVLIGVAFAAIGVRLWLNSGGPTDRTARIANQKDKAAEALSNFQRDVKAEQALKDKQAMQALELEAAENELDRTLWAPEMEAERFEEFFINLWDSVNGAEDKWAVLRAHPPFPIRLALDRSTEHLPLGITRTTFLGSKTNLSSSACLEASKKSGQSSLRIINMEARHEQFQPGAAGREPQSIVKLTVNLLDAASKKRVSFQADLHVHWGLPQSAEARALPQLIEVENAIMTERDDPSPFQALPVVAITPRTGDNFIDPLIVYDLDGDGLPEIILPACNLVYRRNAANDYHSEPLCAIDPGVIFSALIADFNQDGNADLICADTKGLLLYEGDDQGRFLGAPRRVWEKKLPFTQVMTAGDVDGNGTLDLWLGQYRNPYEKGKMPHPYHDANEGFPSYLLLNDGRGNFRDATDASGLAAKRFRPVYSASLADMNGDGTPDLVEVSDFAGVDIFLNDGKGHFQEATASLIPERHLFGMAHVIGDFNSDGRLDLLAIGMNSPAADRLDFLGLSRPGFPEDQRYRKLMTYGNRLYLGSGHAYIAAPQNDDIAKTGWSWGATAFDLDNDGHLDFFVANGHRSNQSVREYEPQFWRHDVYLGQMTNKPVVDLYYKMMSARIRGHGASYGGYEKKRLFLNRGGKGFLEAGFVFGVGLEEDCRNAISADLDGDGRMDLLTTTVEVWPQERQTLRIFRNRLPQVNHWIGFRLREQGAGLTPIGAKVVIRTSQREQIRYLITGDSHRSQHPCVAHFGLGDESAVAEAEIIWPNGRHTKISSPAVDRYHWVKP